MSGYKDRIKTLATEVAELTNQAKTLYTEIEVKGADAPADERTKLSNLIDDGKAKRSELERLQTLQENDDFINMPKTSARAVGGDDPRFYAPQRKSWGDLVTDSDAFKTAKKNNDTNMGRVQVKSVRQVKALYGSTDANGGYLVRTERDPELVSVVGQRPRSVIDLVNQSETESDAVEYVEMTSRTNNAAVVPEYSGGDFGLKPESDLVFNMRTAPVKTIATWIRASRQILQDAPQLRALVDDELTYMVEITLENQILNGNGTGSNFVGMLNHPDIQVRTMHATTPVGRDQATTDTRIDTIRRAVTDIQLEFYEATGIVISPALAESLELAKDTTGNYLNVYDPVQQRVWRTPVVATPAMAGLTGLVGNFRLAATLWDRLMTEIRISENVNDDFIRNAVRVLAELRAAFGLKRPRALEKITFI